jgi:hypothetical protein
MSACVSYFTGITGRKQRSAEKVNLKLKLAWLAKPMSLKPQGANHVCARHEPPHCADDPKSHI